MMVLIHLQSRLSLSSSNKNVLASGYSHSKASYSVTSFCLGQHHISNGDFLS